MKFDKDVFSLLSLVSHIGIVMALPIIGCIVLGSILDRAFHTRVLFLIIFTILGTLTAFRNLFVIGTKAHKKKP